jgi:hypothetical protein
MTRRVIVGGLAMLLSAGCVYAKGNEIPREGPPAPPPPRR